MSTGADVSIQVRFSAEAIDKLRQLTEAAIDRALNRFRERLKAFAITATPKVTGRLKSSVDIALTPRSVVLKWDAEDKGFHYADPVDKGYAGPHGVSTARHFSELVRWEAPRMLVEELEWELGTIQMVGGP